MMLAHKDTHSVPAGVRVMQLSMLCAYRYFTVTGSCNNTAQRANAGSDVHAHHVRGVA